MVKVLDLNTGTGPASTSMDWYRLVSKEHKTKGLIIWLHMITA